MLIIFLNKNMLSGVQISFRRLTEVGVTSKFWLKFTDVKRHCRKVGNLSEILVNFYQYSIL